MAFLLGHVKVEDYTRWRAAFDGAVAMRAAAGCKGAHLFQAAGDPNEVWMTLTFDDQATAQAMMGRDDIRQAIKDSGVIGDVEVHMIEDAGRLPS